ncbi:hypothetical protein HK096_006519, partial [Nowakowskiella sp. JEL0078]
MRSCLILVIVSIFYVLPNTSDARLVQRGNGSLKDWDFCTTSSQCKNDCCSKEYSNDGKLKCTPWGKHCVVASKTTTTKLTPSVTPTLGDWQFCTTSSQCKNHCCSKEYSNDGKLKCTPYGTYCVVQTSSSTFSSTVKSNLTTSATTSLVTTNTGISTTSLVTTNTGISSTSLVTTNTGISSTSLVTTNTGISEPVTTTTVANSDSSSITPTVTSTTDQLTSTTISTATELTTTATTDLPVPTQTNVPIGNCQPKTGSTASIPDSAIIVAQDGSGNFLNVSSAIQSISGNNSAEQVVYIKSGVYYETVNITQNFITLVGDGQCKTVITYDNYVLKINNSNSYMSSTVYVAGSDFRAFHLTFQNTSPWPIPTKGQAPAFGSFGDRTFIEDCGFVSGEDTIAIATGSAYITK